MNNYLYIKKKKKKKKYIYIYIYIYIKSIKFWYIEFKKFKNYNIKTLIIKQMY